MFLYECLQVKKKILTEPLWLDLNMCLTLHYFGSHRHTWAISKGKNTILFLRLPVFLIDYNLSHIETFKYRVFFLEVNNKFIDFFLLNFVRAAVLMDLTIKLKPLMVPLITLNTFSVP